MAGHMLGYLIGSLSEMTLNDHSYVGDAAFLRPDQLFSAHCAAPDSLLLPAIFQTGPLVACLVEGPCVKM